MSNTPRRLPSEELSLEDLQAEFKDIRIQLHSMLLLEAKRLEMKEDLWTLRNVKNKTFDATPFLHYGTHPEVSRELKEHIRLFVHVRNQVDERQDLEELVRTQRARIQKGAFVLGSMALFLLVMAVWRNTTLSSYELSIRNSRARKLKWGSIFSHHTGLSNASVAAQMAPAAPVFTVLRPTPKRLAQRGRDTPYSLRPTLWVGYDASNRAYEGWLMGTLPDFVIQALELRKNKQIVQHPYSSTGALYIPADQLKMWVKHTQQLERTSNGLVRVFRYQRPSLDIRKQLEKGCLHSKHSTRTFDLRPMLWVHPVVRCGSQKQPKTTTMTWKLDVSKLLKSLKIAQKRHQKASNQHTWPHIRTGIHFHSSPLLWDALLRNQALPADPLPGMTRGWIHRFRLGIWQKVYSIWLKEGLSLRALTHHHIVFRTRLKGSQLHITPYWMLDPSRHTLHFSATHPIPVWKPKKQPKPSSPTLTDTPTNYFSMRFPGLQSSSKMRNLLDKGMLYAHFETFWQANVPAIYPWDQRSHVNPHVSAFAPIHKDSIRMFAQLRMYLSLKRIVHSLQHTDPPLVGPTLLALKSIAKPDPALKKLRKKLRERIGPASPYTQIKNLSLRYFMLQEVHKHAQRAKQKFKQWMLRYPSSRRPPSMRILQARMLFEEGHYAASLQNMLQPKEWIAFYHPLLRFKVGKGDQRGPLRRWKAKLHQPQTHNNGVPQAPTLLIEASTRINGALQPILYIENIPEGTSHKWVQRINAEAKVDRSSMPSNLLLSEQILMHSSSVRTSIRLLQQKMYQPDMVDRILLNWVRGCSAPCMHHLPNTRMCR